MCNETLQYVTYTVLQTDLNFPYGFLEFPLGIVLDTRCHKIFLSIFAGKIYKIRINYNTSLIVVSIMLSIKLISYIYNCVSQFSSMLICRPPKRLCFLRGCVGQYQISAGQHVWTSQKIKIIFQRIWWFVDAVVRFTH